VTATAAPELPEVPALPRRRSPPGAGITGGLVGRARAGIVTTGQLVTLAVDASVFIATDIVRRRFSWSEFLLQASFWCSGLPLDPRFRSLPIRSTVRR
jgi:hypothetical protein